MTPRRSGRVRRAPARTEPSVGGSGGRWAKRKRREKGRRDEVVSGLRKMEFSEVEEALKEVGVEVVRRVGEKGEGYSDRRFPESDEGFDDEVPKEDPVGYRVGEKFRV